VVFRGGIFSSQYFVGLNILVDAREAVKALIVANQFLVTDLEKLRAAVSTGYARGRLFEPVPRDRKDWYD